MVGYTYCDFLNVHPVNKPTVMALALCYPPPKREGLITTVRGNVLPLSVTLVSKHKRLQLGNTYNENLYTQT